MPDHITSQVRIGGEMEGYEEIGDKAWDYFSAYQNVEVEYNG